MLKSGFAPASRNGRSHGSAESGGSDRDETDSRGLRSVTNQYPSASSANKMQNAAATQLADQPEYVPVK